MSEDEYLNLALEEQNKNNVQPDIEQKNKIRKDIKSCFLHRKLVTMV